MVTVTWAILPDVARSPTPALAAGALVLGLGLGACAPGAAVDLRGRPVRLTVSEYRVTPGRARVSPGPLRLEVRNAGVLSHQVAVGRGALILRRTDWLHPGQSVVISLDATPGLLRVFDPTGVNDAAGLSGTLVVR